MGDSLVEELLVGFLGGVQLAGRCHPLFRRTTDIAAAP